MRSVLAIARRTLPALALVGAFIGAVPAAGGAPAPSHGYPVNVTVPVSSVPSADGVVAIGELAVTVVDTASVPVLVSVSSVTATLLSVMNFRSRTESPVRLKTDVK